MIRVCRRRGAGRAVPGQVMMMAICVAPVRRSLGQGVGVGEHVMCCYFAPKGLLRCLKHEQKKVCSGAHLPLHGSTCSATAWALG